MKKTTVILVSAFMILSLSTIAFAAENTNQKDEATNWNEVAIISSVKIPEIGAVTTSGKSVPQTESNIVIIPDQTVPESGLYTILDEPVPIAGPKTGSSIAIAYFAFVTGTLGMAYLICKERHRTVL